MTKVEQIKKLVKENKKDFKKIVDAISSVDGVYITFVDNGMTVEVRSADYIRFLGTVEIRKSSNPFEDYWYVKG